LITVVGATSAAGQTAEGPAKRPAPQPVKAASPANAGQIAGQDADRPAVADAAPGILAFPPSFFAGARPNTAADMVARVPGFSISQNTSVRGFSGSVGNVLIDGARPASKAEGLSEILSRIPATDVERIELIRGGAPGVEMQGFSQVVNVVRRKAASRQHVVTLGGVVFDDGRGIPSASYALNGRKGDRIYEFSLGTSSSISTDAGTGRITRLNPFGEVIRFTNLESEADGLGYFGRARLQQPLAGGTVEASGNLARNEFKFEQNEDGPTFAQQFVDRSDITTGEVSLRYERPFSPRSKGEFRGIQRLTERIGLQIVENTASSQIFNFDNSSGESILRASLRFAQNSRLSWEGGAEGAFNFLDAKQVLLINGRVVPLPSDAVRVEELRAEGFVTVAWRLRPTLTADASMRVEISRISQSRGANLQREFVYPKPRVLVSWTPIPNNQFRLRLERQVSQLDFTQFAASAQLSEGRLGAGNAELEPQKTSILEVVYERRFWGDGVFTATVNAGRITDFIDILPIFDEDGSVFPAPGNIGNAEFSALVLETTVPTDRLRVPGGRLRLRGSWVKSEVTDPLTGERRRPSFQSPFVGTIGFTQDLPRRRINWGADYNLPIESRTFRIEEVSYDRLEDLASAFVEYKPQPQLSLRLQFNDIGFQSRTRRVFAGPRDRAGLRFVEVREVSPESRIQFRVRRTF